MSRKFAVFDIDGTVYRYALYISMVAKLMDMGKIPGASAAEYNAAREAWRRRSHDEAYRDFTLKAIDIFESNLDIITVEDMKKAASEILKESSKHSYVYTRNLIKKLRSEDYFLIAITGSMTEVSHLFAKAYGFDDIASTHYHNDGKKYDGELTMRAHNKHLTINEMMKKHNLTITGSLAVGDSMGDSSMLEMVDNPIAFNPEKKLFELARKNNWKVVLERKNVIYELEAENGEYSLAKTS